MTITSRPASICPHYKKILQKKFIEVWKRERIPVTVDGRNFQKTIQGSRGVGKGLDREWELPNLEYNKNVMQFLKQHATSKKNLSGFFSDDHHSCHLTLLVVGFTSLLVVPRRVDTPAYLF